MTKEQQIKEAHINWLSKTETAKINGAEMTVLPYGFLSQAVKEAIEIAEKRGAMKERKFIKREISKKEKRVGNGNYDENALETAEEYYRMSASEGGWTEIIRLEDGMKSAFETVKEMLSNPHK